MDSTPLAAFGNSDGDQSGVVAASSPKAMHLPGLAYIIKANKSQTGRTWYKQMPDWIFFATIAAVIASVFYLALMKPRKGGK